MKLTKLYLKTLAFALIVLFSIAKETSAEPLLSDADRATMASLLKLSHDKQLRVFERLDIIVPVDFYNCVCKSAGYGSGQAQQFYHPDTIGEPDERYICQQPGPPCIVRGYGCLRYPMPSKPDIWTSCAVEQADIGEVSIMDEFLNKVQAFKKKKPDPDMTRALAQCRKQKAVQDETRFAMKLLDGFRYMVDSGVPLLAPPPRIARDMNAHAAALTAQISNARKAQAKKADQNLAAFAAEKVFKNQTTYEYLKSFALEMTVALEAEDTQELGNHENHLKTLKSQYPKENYPSHVRADIEKTKVEINRLKTNLSQYKRDQDHLAKFQLGIEDAVNVQKTAAGLEKLVTGNGRGRLEGTLELAQVIQVYVNRADGRQDLATAALEKAAESFQPEDLNALGSSQTRRKLLKGFKFQLDHAIFTGDMALKAHAKYNDFLKQVEEAENMAASGKYSEAETRLITAFNAMSSISNEASAYLPPGASDVLQIYAEAMKTPGAVHKMLTKSTERYGVMAEVSGSQSRGTAIEEASTKLGSLNQADYLFQSGGLSVYVADRPPSGGPTHVLIPDKNGKPIYLTPSQHNRLEEFAYYWPILHGRKMTDAEAAQNFANVETGVAPSITSLKAQAEAKLKDAARRYQVAQMMGKKQVDGDDLQTFHEFSQFVAETLPRGCALSLKRQEALFGAWRENPSSESSVASLWRGLTGTPAVSNGRQAVKEYLSVYGRKLKDAAGQLE